MARKMKDSGIEWIGEIPEGWELVKLKYLSAFPVEKNIDPNSPYIGLENIESWSGKYIPSNSQFDKSQALIFSKGDILFGKLRPYLAKVFFAFDSGCCSSEFCIMTFSSNLNAHYYWNILISPTFINEVTQSTYGTKMPRANTDFIRNIFVPVPSKNDQNQIAEYLNIECSRIDAILSKTRASIEEYKKLKQAVITQAVTKGVRGEREMKDSGVEWIGEIPKEWVIQKIKSISSRINVGVVIRPSEYFDENGTVPFLRGINVKEYLISSDNMVYINESSNHILSKSQVHTDDILIVRDGSIGTSCVVPAEYDGANVVSMVIVTPSISCDSRFICYSLNSDVGKTQFTLTKIGSALTHTSVSAVSDIIVAVPSCAEQKEIADYLDAKCAEIDKLIAKKEQLVKELESYKKSLIYEVVTGKREV